MGAWLWVGCDVGRRIDDPSTGPKLELVASYPAEGDGLGCRPGGPPDCGIPIHASIELRFDRYLLPSTAIRQSIVFFTGTEQLSVFTEPHYDVTERVLRYALQPGQGLHPGARYRVHVEVPAENESGFGLRAFDGVPIGADGPVPLDFSFRTQEGPPAPVAVDPIPTCADVLGVFRRGGCSSATCHQSSATPGCPVGFARTDDGPCVGVPRMDLDLESVDGLLRTAMSKVAHQTDTEANAGVPAELPPRFGLGMPIIDPGRPENSYLVYKMIINRGSYGPDPCGGSAYQVGLDGQCVVGSAAEIDRLRDWFVRGDPMPPVIDDSPLEAADLRLVERWILGGAETSDCSVTPGTG